jgi:hypothetical protein
MLHLGKFVNASICSCFFPSDFFSYSQSPSDATNSELLINMMRAVVFDEQLHSKLRRVLKKPDSDDFQVSFGKVLDRMNQQLNSSDSCDSDFSLAETEDAQVAAQAVTARLRDELAALTEVGNQLADLAQQQWDEVAALEDACGEAWSRAQQARVALNLDAQDSAQLAQAVTALSDPQVLVARAQRSHQLRSLSADRTTVGSTGSSTTTASKVRHASDDNTIARKTSATRTPVSSAPTRRDGMSGASARGNSRYRDVAVGSAYASHNSVGEL